MGFRGGMARPFQLALPSGDELWEVPMLLMDGPLFADMALDTEGVVEHSIRLLKEVKRRNGCVAINWHERACSPDYGWGKAYQRILQWAKDEGFRFQSLANAVLSYRL